MQIDVHWVDGVFFIGNEEPQHKLHHPSWLENPKLWCRARSIDALDAMIINNRIHCFFHDKDEVVLTSRQFLWTLSTIQTVRSIAVLPELNGQREFRCAGVCSDFIRKIKAGGF